MMEINTLKLSEFGEYILKKRLVPENKAKFCVGGVRKPVYCMTCACNALTTAVFPASLPGDQSVII
jgi:hypothetical protein